MTTDPKILGHIEALASAKNGPAMTAFTHRLVGDHEFRAQFLANPTKALADVGVHTDQPVTLSPRDQALVNLVADTHVTDLYKSGNMAALREYIAAKYAGLSVVNPQLARESAIADFDVAIEAEAVAVAVVAVAAIAIAAVVADQGHLAIEERAVLNARIAALEARMRLLEGKVR